MKIIESIIEPITGYLKCMVRNTEKGWYELEVGIHKNWVFDENNEIGCEIIAELDGGKLIKIFPKNENIVIDDLFLFVEVIIKTNEQIAEREKQFAAQMEEMKKSLELQASEFYKELDELKENSFKKINDNFVVELKKDSGNKKSKDKEVLKFTSPGISYKEYDNNLIISGTTSIH
jgi:hypothetical protein